MTGVVVRVEREDIDKSGRNPRFLYTLVVRPDGPDAIEGVPAGARVPDELPGRIKAAELTRMMATPPVAGDRVRVVARGAGPSPVSFYLDAVAPAGRV